MQPHFQKILIPVDFTEKNRSALDIGFDLATAGKSRITLLHVIETMDLESDAELKRFYKRLETRAETELATMSQRFETAALTVDRKIRFGKRLTEIVADSVERGADLIVMSSHKPNLSQPSQTWATLSYQVSALCQCPVLLAK